MTDILIIGGGPAGLSAAINVLQRSKTCVVLTRDYRSNILYKTHSVTNYLGMTDVSGAELLDAYMAHAIGMGVQIKTGRVTQTMSMGDYFTIQFDDDILEAKRIILATGVSKSKTIPGEETFVGRGVSYCATCDGMLYRGKDVLVISDVDEAAHDIGFLSGICKSVSYAPKGTALDVSGYANVSVLRGKVTEIFGGVFAEGVVIDGEKHRFDGVFIISATMPAGNLVYGLDTADGYISVDRLMRTSVPGVYACGDCTGWPLQVSKAVGEGLIAAQTAVRELEHNG